jgi:hypothetical protein
MPRMSSPFAPWSETTIRRKWIRRRPRFLLACGSVVATPHGNPVKLSAAVYKTHHTARTASVRTECIVRAGIFVVVIELKGQIGDEKW